MKTKLSRSLFYRCAIACGTRSSWAAVTLLFLLFLCAGGRARTDEAKIVVYRDRYGIAHILAPDDQAAAFAFGFVQAQDRLFMMDGLRRAATGRLAEILGPFAFPMDKEFSVYDFETVAERMHAKLSFESKRVLEAFIAGVNHAVETKRYSRFLYDKLGVAPAPFTVEDSLAVSAFTSFFLAESASRKMMILDLVEHVGLQEAEAILGLRLPPQLQTILGGAGTDDSRLPLRPDFPWVPRFGSNNWVISRAKSKEGAAMLANDPHVPLLQPAFFYEAHLKTPDWEVYGVTVPLIPVIAIGFTPHVSFGATVSWADVMDVILMPWDRKKKKVFDGKEWLDVETIVRERKIKGGQTKKITVYRTPYGPILARKGTHAAVLRWSFDQQPKEALSFYPDLLRARNVVQAAAHVRRFAVSSANFVLADTEGNIAYQLSGMIPIKKGPYPHVPYVAGQVTWEGFIPPEELLSIQNPPEGFLYTANHDFFESIPYPFSNYFAPGYRARRIRELLEEKPKLSRKDMEKMMTDDLSVLATDLVPDILALVSPKDQGHPLVLALKKWDGHCDLTSVGCSVFHVLVQVLIERVFQEALGPVYPAFLEARYWAVPRLIAYLRGEISSSRLPGDRRKLLKEALAETDRRLKESGAIGLPRWGDLHQVLFENPFDRLGFSLSVGPFPMAGALFGVGRADWNLTKPFTANFGAPFRLVAIMKDPVEAYTVVAPGQHEDPDHRHGRDQVEAWRNGTLRPVILDTSELEGENGEALELIFK